MHARLVIYCLTDPCLYVNRYRYMGADVTEVETEIQVEMLSLCSCQDL